MEAVMNRLVMMMSIALSLLVGCKDEVQCERTRMDLNKAWSELRSAATRRLQEGTDVPTWTEIEKKTELLESSFMTPQVTWTSAAQAGQAIAAKLPALESTGDAGLVGFRTSAESALKRQTAFEKECR